MQVRSTYSAVAIFLHWTLAILLLGMIPFGWWMGDAIKEPETQALAAKAFQLHKSIGLTILALTLVRIAWRLTHKPQPLPEAMPPWEKTVALATHLAFYLALLIIPLSGWAYVSAGYSVSFQQLFSVATSYFGLFEVPHWAPIASAPEDTRKTIAMATETVHSKMAWVVLVLAALHVAAAVKHHIIDKDDVLARMLPLLRPLRKG